MRIVTWNVNSVRARLPRLLPWLAQTSPDVVFLQETKCRDEDFPREPIEEAGYCIEAFGQKTYNGVAILSKRPMDSVFRGFPGDGGEKHRRVIGGQLGDLLLLNAYFVNGKEVGSEPYAFKLDWMSKLVEFMSSEFSMDERVVMGGDFNVTFDDRDIHDPERWHERILCSTPEREALGRFIDAGLVDSLRAFNSDAGVYTWWDFRTRGFDRGQGLRIDHFLLSASAMAVCKGVEVDLEARGGEKPSDHAPVIVTLD